MRVINFHTTEIERNDTCNSLARFFLEIRADMRRIQDCIFGIYNRGTTCTQTYRMRTKKNFIIVINFYQNNWSAINLKLNVFSCCWKRGTS